MVNLIKRYGMKLASTIVAATLLSVAMPQTAEAKHDKRKVAHHCGACHQPVYAEYRRVGYDHCGHPIYRWVQLGHDCRHRNHGQGYGSGNEYGQHYGSRDPVADVIGGILRSISYR